VRDVKNIDRGARALYQRGPKLSESNYRQAYRFLNLKTRKRSLVCLLTDIVDREENNDIIAYLIRFARFHLPVAVTLSNPELNDVVRKPMTEVDPYFRTAATDVLAAREEALEWMRQRSLSVVIRHLF